MNIAGAIVIFVIWWWVIFIAVQSVGVRARWESEDDGVVGADPGAPENPEIGKKAVLATKITVPLWAVTCAIIMSGIIDFRQ